MEFDHDVFISYSHHNVAWAKKLTEALKDRQLRIFLDEQRLNAGDKWESALLENLKRSRTLVILWSADAKGSDWVTRERGFFDAWIADQSGKESALGSRRLILVLLDDTQHAFDSFQTINGLRDVEVVPGMADEVDPNVWSRVVVAVEEAVRNQVDATAITLVVLASTRLKVAGLNPLARQVFAPTLKDALQNFGFASDQELHDFYANAPTSWRPYKGGEEIQTLLDELLMQLNALVSELGQRFRWQPISEDFWSSDNEKFVRAARTVAAGPSLVVVDPISLYDQEVQIRLRHLEEELALNEEAALMVLAPCSADDRSRTLRSIVEHLAERVHTHLYRAANPNRRLQATCDVGVLDVEDMKRVLLPALRKKLRRAAAGPIHPVLSTGQIDA